MTYAPSLRLALTRAEISRATLGGSPCHPRDKDKAVAAILACVCTDVCDLACAPCGELGFDNEWKPLRDVLHHRRGYRR